jgi:hypothetical protein
LDERLDRLIKDWTQTLLANLADPIVTSNVELVSSTQGRKAIEQFVSSRQLLDPVNPTFVKTLQEVLSGLEKVVVKTERLHSALANGGVPCTVAELRDRFERYVADITKGKDPGKIRVVME